MWVGFFCFAYVQVCCLLKQDQSAKEALVTTLIRGSEKVSAHQPFKALLTTVLGAPWLDNGQPIALLKTNKQNSDATMKSHVIIVQTTFRLSISSTQSRLESRLRQLLLLWGFYQIFPSGLIASFRILLPLRTISNLTRQRLRCTLQIIATGFVQKAGKDSSVLIQIKYCFILQKI